MSESSKTKLDKARETADLQWSKTLVILSGIETLERLAVIAFKRSRYAIYRREA
jgi:hypothetical protein